MRLLITVLVLILCSLSCKEKVERTSETKKEKTELKVELTQKIGLIKVLGSLELTANISLTGDFNGDNKTDFASVVKNKNNRKHGVLIIHNSAN
jgi:Na+/melibiose symporter-like transporter